MRSRVNVCLPCVSVGLALLALLSPTWTSLATRNIAMIGISYYLSQELTSPAYYFSVPCQCSHISRMDSINLSTTEFSAIDLARLQFYQGHYHETIRMLAQRPQERDRQELADYFVGASYLCLNNGAMAAQYWHKDEVAWAAFGGVYKCQRADQAQWAGTLYDLALEIRPELLSGWHLSWPQPALAYYLAAATVAKQRNLSEIELKWLKLGKKLFPQSPLAAHSLGIYHERKGEWAIAKSFYQQALNLSPSDDPSMYQYYIRASFALKEWVDGVNAARKLLVDVAPDSDWQWHLVAMLTQKYRSKELCSQMETFVNAVENPSSPSIAASINAIRHGCNEY